MFLLTAISVLNSLPVFPPILEIDTVDTFEIQTNKQTCESFEQEDTKDLRKLMPHFAEWLKPGTSIINKFEKSYPTVYSENVCILKM